MRLLQSRCNNKFREIARFVVLVFHQRRVQRVSTGISTQQILKDKHVQIRNLYKKQSPGVDTQGLLVKALISSYFIVSLYFQFESTNIKYIFNNRNIIA